MKILCGLALMPLFIAAQDAAPKPVQKLISVKYIDANSVHNLLRNFAPGNDWSMESDNRLHVIALRGRPETVATLEEAIKKLDVAPPDFELTVYLISSSPQAGDQLPDDDFEDGLIADRNQRLRQRDGERMQAGSASAGEDDSAAHGWWLMGHSS